MGILTLPTRNNTVSSTGVVIIVGGPQYRAGSHRQFVQLARALAAGNYPVLRFDYRGMGDSTGAQQDFLDTNADIEAAISALQSGVPSVRHVALWGLCDAASAALLYCAATRDERVTSLCLLNPWVRSEVSLARTQMKHYYLQRLREKAFWVKLINGKVALNAIAGLIQNIRVAIAGPNGKNAPMDTAGKPYQQLMANGWRGFSGRILLILSGRDYTAKEFLEYVRLDATWAGALVGPNRERHDMEDADHTFSDSVSQQTVERLVLAWLDEPVGRRRS